MPVYEYKVVPAPEKGLKGKGLKSARERFANALQTVMNQLGADGWEYVRADTLPCEERSGLTGTSTSYQNMLVFRRERSATAERPVVLRAPEIVPAVESAPEADAKETPELPYTRQTGEPEKTKDAAAAAAAAAALTAYRDSTSGAPKLGPAPERRPDRDS